MMAVQPDLTDRWRLRWQHALFGFPLAIALVDADPALGAGPVLLVALAVWYAFWYVPWRARHPYAPGRAAGTELIDINGGDTP